MGTTRLPSLPQRQRWREVVHLIGAGGGSAAAVASATLDASDEHFVARADDPGLIRAVWLLAQLPDAARSGHFGAALQDLGVSASATPSIAELTSGIAGALDSFLDRHGRRTDIAEMAVGAAVEALARNLKSKTATLFPDAGDVVRGVGQLGTEVQFGRLARDFFARLAKRSLAYYLDRELSGHIGRSRRFQTLADQKRFSDALDLHCQHSASVVEAFAGGWWSKARFEGDLSESRTAGFVRYALKKLRAALHKGAPA